MPAGRTLGEQRKILSIQLDVELSTRKIRLSDVAKTKELIAEMAMEAAREVLGKDGVVEIGVDWNYQYRWAQDEETLTPDTASSVA